MPSTPLRITICCSGSRGELQPYIAVGQALVARGHTVTIASEGRMETFVREFGFTYEKLFGDPTELLWDTDPKVQAALKNGSLMQIMEMNKKIDKKYPKADVYESYISATRNADFLISANLTIFQTAIAADYHRIPWISIILGPTLPTSEFPLWIFQSIACFSCMNKWTYTVVHKMLWAEEKKVIAPLRAKLNLEAWTTPLGLIDVIDKNQIPVVIAASELLCGPKQKAPTDYPSYAKITGFFFVAPTLVDAEIDPVLSTFMCDSDRPIIYLGFGSMPCPFPEDQLQLAYETCQQCHVKAVIIAGWSKLRDNEKCVAILRKAEQEEKMLLVVASAPHDWLFPKVACIVHHCGLGTMAASLKSGIPQIPVPFLLDQPYNAKVVLKLGVAPAVIPFAKLSSKNLVAAIRKVLNDPNFSVRAKTVGDFVNRESASALDTTCEIVERHYESKLLTNPLPLTRIS